MNAKPDHRLAAAAVLTAAVTALGGCSLSGASTPSAAEAAAAEPAVVMNHNGHEHPQSDAAVQLYGEMRALWAQHMEWTYATVVAFAAESPGLTATLNRLLANQEDIGDAIRPFYGKQAASQLTALLKVHINDAVPVLQAARAGDKAALDKAIDEWLANADDIADFLAGANPAWPRGEMRQMMRMHITQTVTYAALQLRADYVGSIREYDQAEQHMMEMADMLSKGIVQQFPDRFSR